MPDPFRRTRPCRKDNGVEFSDNGQPGEFGPSRRHKGSSSSSTSTDMSHGDDVDDLLPVPQIAQPGEPIG